MTAQELTAIGLRLYGPYWKAPLARALGMGRAQIRRYSQGQPIPRTVELAIRAIADGKI